MEFSVCCYCGNLLKQVHKGSSAHRCPETGLVLHQTINWSRLLLLQLHVLFLDRHKNLKKSRKLADKASMLQVCSTMLCTAVVTSANYEHVCINSLSKYFLVHHYMRHISKEKISFVKCSYSNGLGWCLANVFFDICITAESWLAHSDKRFTWHC